MKLKELVMFIGLGNAGCKVAFEFQKLGYKAIMANGSIQDLKVLQGAKNVFHLKGNDGFGGDRSKAMECLADNMEFVEAVTNIEEPIVFVLNSTGGSTGSSTGIETPQLIIENDSEKTVCCVEMLAATNEAIAKHKNTFNTIKELQSIEGLGATIFIDNNSCGGDLKKINTTFVSLLDAFLTDDSWSDKNNFDTSERINMLKEPGAMVLSRLCSEKVESQLIPSITKSNIFAPLQQDHVVGQIGIINSTEKGVNVEALVSEIGKPSNVYMGWGAQKNTLTICSGLSYPTDHILKLGEMAQQEQAERLRNKEQANKKLGDIDFLEEQPVIKQNNQIQKKMSKLELLKQMRSQNSQS